MRTVLHGVARALAAASLALAAPLAASADAESALERATAALDAYRDVEAAERAGYRKPGRNDGFMMGEHWYQPEILAAGVCELERPGFLQYLVIDGQRRLIGAGYVCDVGEDPTPPDWFGADRTWHSHGPALCRTRKGAFMDFQFFADAVPNERTERTWQELCGKLWGEPEHRPVAMLHTWNWIPQPDGPFTHENRAIPFLRAGLAVPDREILDSEAGRAALATLRLAHGDAARRLKASGWVVDLGFAQRWKTRRLVREAERSGRRALEWMREAEREGDFLGWVTAAQTGAAAAQQLRASFELGVLDPEQRPLHREFLASLSVHDHEPAAHDPPRGHPPEPGAHHHTQEMNGRNSDHTGTRHGRDGSNATHETREAARNRP